MTTSILSKFGFLIIENFLKPDFCARLCGEAEANPTVMATVTREGDDTRVDEYVRRTRKGKIAGSTTDVLRLSLLDLKPSLESHFKLSLTGCSEPHVLIYKAGDFFHPHRDNNYKSRLLSIVVFLNCESVKPTPGCFGGGALTFYGLLSDPRCKTIGFSHHATTGQLVAFRSDVMHEVTPVTHGKRYTIISWFH